MRSDYLGECARFEGFAETVNTCQYLLPRLGDFALLRAVHEPATLYGGAIDPAVGDRLLFAMRQEQDGLPVLQHALMRACVHARERHGSVRAGPSHSPTSWAEGEHGALSKHADEVLAEIRARDAGYDESRRMAVPQPDGARRRGPRHPPSLSSSRTSSPLPATTGRA